MNLSSKVSLGGALSFVFGCFPAWAAEEQFSSLMVDYIVKVSLALSILGCLAFVIVKFTPFKQRALRRDVSIITSLPVGRDVIYIVRCGPEVMVIMTGRGGSSLLKSYSLEEWDKYRKCEVGSEDEKS